MSVELRRHVNALVADFAAEYGDFDVVSRRIDCSAETYETLVETFESFGVVGGAGIRVTDESGVLLVQYDGADGWTDPGDSRRPGESYCECAKRGFRQSTGLEASIEDIAEIQLLCFDDWTDRDPAPNPYVSFRGTHESGSVHPGDEVASTRWANDPSDELLYGR